MAYAQAPHKSHLYDCSAPRLGRPYERGVASARGDSFDLFVTSDQNIRYQQALAGRRIAILELSTNKLRRIEAAASLLRATIDA
jgi:uncharacterized linocin/CFP29 family protein